MFGTPAPRSFAISIYTNERTDNLYPSLENSLLYNDSGQKIDTVRDAKINEAANEAFKKYLKNAANENPLINQVATEEAAIEFQQNPQPLKQPNRLPIVISNFEDKRHTENKGTLGGIAMNDTNRPIQREFQNSPPKTDSEILAIVFNPPFNKQIQFLESLKNAEDKILVLNWINCASDVFSNKHDKIRKIINFFCEDPKHYYSNRHNLIISEGFAYGFRRILNTISCRHYRELQTQSNSKFEQVLDSRTNEIGKHIKRKQEEAAIEFKNPNPQKLANRNLAAIPNQKDKNYAAKRERGGIVVNDQTRAKFYEFISYSTEITALDILSKVFIPPFEKQTHFLDYLKCEEDKNLILNWIDCASYVFPQRHDKIRKVINFLCENPHRFYSSKHNFILAEEIGEGFKRILHAIGQK